MDNPGGYAAAEKKHDGSAEVLIGWPVEFKLRSLYKMPRVDGE